MVRHLQRKHKLSISEAKEMSGLHDSNYEDFKKQVFLSE
jgi:hypothetical protein